MEKNRLIQLLRKRLEFGSSAEGESAGIVRFTSLDRKALHLCDGVKWFPKEPLSKLTESVGKITHKKFMAR
jgi:hypothetical protein